jgi:DNA-binding Lrp family transcriptional regulator
MVYWGVLMPRLAKKKYDKIQDMIREGYTNKETAEEVGVSEGTVSRQRKKLAEIERSETAVEPELKVPLSGKSVENLSKIQSMLGVESLDMAVENIFNDYVLIMKEKFEYDSDFEKTPGEVFKDIKAAAKELDRIKKGKDDIDVQCEILRDFNIDEAVISYFIFEKIDDYRGNLIEFIGDNIIEYYTKVKGWAIPGTVKGPIFLNPDDPYIKKG